MTDGAKTAPAGVCPACGSPAGHHLFTVGDCALRAVEGEFTYSRCANCGSVFADPAPDPEVLASAYGSAYGNYRSERGLIERLAEPLLRREAVRVVRAAGAKDLPLVEVGCGTGRFLERLSSAGWRGPISGLEYASQTARETAARTGFKVTAGTAETGALDDGPYGAIVLRHVLEHLVDPHIVLRRLAEHLHPGGVLYVATPDARALSATLFGRRWWGWEVPRHLCVFTSPALRGAVERARMDVVSERWAFAPEMWNASAYLALDRGRGRPWTRPATSLANPLVSAPAALGAAVEVATRRSTMYGLLARRAASAP